MNNELNNNINSNINQYNTNYNNLTGETVNISNNNSKSNNKYIILIIVIIIVIIGIALYFIFGTKIEKNSLKNNCKFETEYLFFGTTYEKGAYTYIYQEDETWGVFLTDEDSTDPITDKICTHINGTAVTDMSHLFSNSKAESIDLSSFNTSEVKKMDYMFASIKVDSLDLSGFETKNLETASSMFFNSEIKKLDLSNFNISKVTDATNMFFESKIDTLNISNFEYPQETLLSISPIEINTVFAKNQKEIDSFSKNIKTNSDINYKIEN